MIGRRVWRHMSKKYISKDQRLVGSKWVFKVKNEAMKDAKGRNCTEYYHYWENVFCVQGSRIDPDFKEMYKKNRKVIFVNGHLSFYKWNWDQTGTPYERVLDLRRDKIKNFLSVKDWDRVTNLIPVNYEKLVNEGMGFLLKDIVQRLGETRACKVFPPQARMHNPLTLEYLQYIDDHVDWNTEALIGYTKGNYANLIIVTKQDEEKENKASYIDKDEEQTKSKDENQITTVKTNLKWQIRRTIKMTTEIKIKY